MYFHNEVVVNLPEKIVAMQIFRMNVQFQMLIAEPQSSNAKYHCLQYARGTGLEQVMASLLLQRQQPQFDQSVQFINGAKIFPQVASLSPHVNALVECWNLHATRSIL